MNLPVRLLAGVLAAMLVLGLQGCALKPENHNQSIFEQALVLQQVAPTQAGPGQQTDSSKPFSQRPDFSQQPHQSEVNWFFPAGETTLSDAQVTELFNWLAIESREKASDYKDFVLLLRQGPDWLSSHNRGKAIRNLIPRALTVRQEYHPDMQPHRVSLKMVNVQAPASKAILKEKQKTLKSETENAEVTRNGAMTREQIMALIRQGGRNEQ